MKKRLNQLMAISVAAGMVMGMTSVGAFAETTESDDNLPSDVELTLWTDQSIDPDVWQAEFEKFSEEYADKNYTLNIEAFAGSDRATKMAAAIESDSLPDMGLYAWFTDTDWCHEGYVLDISDVVDPVKDQLYSSVYEETRLNGSSYMLPLWSNYWSIIYNADMLKDAGVGDLVPDDPNEVTIWTLDDFEKILDAVSSSMSDNQYCLPLCAADNQGDTTNLLYLTMLGGELWKDGYSNAGNDQNVIDALEKMGSWVDAGYTNSDVVSKSNNDVASDFTNGLCAMSYGYYSNYVDYKNQMADGSIDTFDIRIAAFPKTADGEDTYALSNYIYGISAFDTGDDDRITVTKLFLNWLANNTESLKNICLAVSSYQEIATDPEVIEENPMFESYSKVVDEDHLFLFHGNVAGYVSTRSMLFPQLQAFYSGDEDAQTALTTYMDQANESIQEYMDNSVILNK